MASLVVLLIRWNLFTRLVVVGPLFMYFILPILWDFMALSVPLTLGFSIPLVEYLIVVFF